MELRRFSLAAHPMSATLPVPWKRLPAGRAGKNCPILVRHIPLLRCSALCRKPRSSAHPRCFPNIALWDGFHPFFRHDGQPQTKAGARLKQRAAPPPACRCSRSAGGLDRERGESLYWNGTGCPRILLFAKRLPSVILRPSLQFCHSIEFYCEEVGSDSSRAKRGSFQLHRMASCWVLRQLLHCGSESARFGEPSQALSL